MIDLRKDEARDHHILRMQRGECQPETGFIWSDLLTGLERAAGHCSNIAGCVIDASRHQLQLHETLRNVRLQSPEFSALYQSYAKTYALE